MPVVMEVVDDSYVFFPPVSSDLIDGLLGQYQSAREKIEQVAGIIAGDMGNVVHYFLEGNKENAGRYTTVERLFNQENAIKALNSAYWSKTLGLTDVLDCMPQKRRDEWNKSITEMTAPDFTEDAVRPTIASLLASRQQFFAERVDGIFRGLSGDHVTNVPEGFRKRMIIGWMLSYGSISSSKAGLINDLRCVIAKFMGRDEPKYNASQVALRQMYNKTGEWNTLDAGALRVRVYKKGTAHLEVHPDISWRLNMVLARLYPSAIPAQFRAKPPKRAKNFKMMDRPLPFAVLELLAADQRYSGDEKLFKFEYRARENTAAYNEAVRILLSIGAVMTKAGDFEFGYPYKEVLQEIVVTGCVPDQKAHQFYPTPSSIAAIAAEMANIGDDDTVLEPSAGQGDLASYLPKEGTVCVEISALHCDILKARGFNVIEADFIEWAPTAPTFDRVVMNPPFSEGRALAHLQAAAGLVKQGGRIVAILPASFRGKEILPGWIIEWSTVFSGEFAGTSVSVVIASGTATGGAE